MERPDKACISYARVRSRCQVIGEIGKFVEQGFYERGQILLAQLLRILYITHRNVFDQFDRQLLYTRF